VISDSGSVSEESAIFGFRAVTMRDSMERPEALEAGSVPMVGLGSQEVIRGIELVADRNKVPIPPDYQITDFSDRLLTFIYSTVSQRDFWLGIRGRGN